MDERVKHRVRLWLTSERVFGLPSVQSTVSELDLHETLAAPVVASAPAPVQTPSESRQPEMFVRPAVPARPTAAARPVTTVTPTVTSPSAPLAAPNPLDPPFSAPLLPLEERRARLIALEENEVRGCTKCRLCETRTNTVFGEGDPMARLFFIGEGPGQNEDEQGRPFVGRAGELLNKWIAAMGLAREQVFIANVVKCRPPGNREPAPDEVATCTPYLQRQLEIVRPHVIITLGRLATQFMLATKLSMSRMRGQWHTWRGIKLMPTYHPAYVLRSYTVETRGAVWSDLQKAMAELGLPMPKKKSAATE